MMIINCTSAMPAKHIRIWAKAVLGQDHLFLQIVWPFLAKTAIIVVLHWVLESGKAGGTPA